MGSYRRVLVGTDGSDSSYVAVDRAAAIARDAGAALLVVTAYRQTDGGEGDRLGGSAPAETALQGALKRVEANGAPPDVDTAAILGDPIDVLVETAKQREADLLVVGNRGFNSLAGRLLGSVPSVVAHRSPCDVLIVAST